MASAANNSLGDPHTYARHARFSLPPLPFSHRLAAPRILRQVLVSSFALQPGARVVWCLRRRIVDVRCLVSGRVPVEVQIVHDRDVVVSEFFEEEWMAMNWARAYAERLRAQGWHDVSERETA